VNLFDKWDPWSPPLIKGSLIDRDKLMVGTPVPLVSSHNETVYGDSLLDITHKLSVAVGVSGSYGNFSGSVASKFGLNEERIEKRHLLHVSRVVAGSRVFIRGGRDGLKSALAADFRTKLESAAPDQLFEDYGTHIITGIQMGGRADRFCQSADITTKTESDLRVAADASYQVARAGVDVNTTVTDEQRNLARQVTGSQSLTVIGGSSTSRENVETNKQDSWTSWASSCDDEPGFLSLDLDSDDGGLVPIWELVADSARKALLHKTYRQLAAMSLRTHLMLATSPQPAPHPDVTVEVPNGYTMLSGGAFDDWSQPGNMLTASYPSSNNAWRASGKDHRESSPARITAYAIVTKDPENIWDVAHFKSDLSAKVPHPSQNQSVGEGYKLIGGGAYVDYRGNGNLLTASYPDDQTWKCTSKDHMDGYNDPAQIQAFAIGLKCNVAGIEFDRYINPNSGTDPTGYPVNTVTSRRNHVMVGGGAAVKTSGPGSLLTASYPKDTNTWEARAKHHYDASPATIDVYAIGIFVHYSQPPSDT
jgi:hypothetical protein